MNSDGFIPEQIAEPARLTVNVSPAKLSENVYQTSLTFGTIRPKRSSSLAFSRSGRVAKVSYSLGELIEEGEKIAELEQDELVKQQEELDEALTAAQSQLATYQSRNNRQQVARLQDEIAGLSSQQEKLIREISKGFVIAPYSAQLLESNAKVGDLVPGGQPLFRIFEAAQPIIELNLPTEVASKTKVGQEVWIKRGGGQVAATVASKSLELDASSRTQLVTLNLTQTDGNQDWIYGEIVEVHFRIATDNSGFWLPHSALQREVDGLWSAYVIESAAETQTVGRRILEVVQLEAEYSLVRGSLNEGDLYVVDGLNRLVPGQLVVGNLVDNEFRLPELSGVGE